MIFKCHHCNCNNNFIRCNLCKKYFYSTKTEKEEIICLECEIECENIYNELVKSKLKKELSLKEQINNLPNKYKKLIIEFDDY
jgi:hypothetical protein